MATLSLSSANRFTTSVSSRAPLSTKSPQLLFIEKRGVSIAGVQTVHAHTPTQTHTSQRCTLSLVCSFVRSRKKKTFRTPPLVWTCPRGWKGGMKVLSCKIKIQPSHVACDHEGQSELNSTRGVKWSLLLFSEIRVSGSARELVTPYESKGEEGLRGPSAIVTVICGCINSRVCVLPRDPCKKSLV